MELTDFIIRSNECRTEDELVRHFSQAIRAFGFDKFVYSLMRGSLAGNDKAFHGIVRSYPEDWMQHYAQAGYLDNDPTYRLALQRKGVFSWKQLESSIRLSAKERQVMREAEDAKLRSGVSLSLHGPYGEAIGFGFASNDEQEGLSANQFSILYAMANQFHLVLGTLRGTVLPIADITLSDRQRSVLQWAAAGKSRSVIADIMKISEDTVDSHFRHIFRKLQCNDRTSAALKAAQLGLIRV